MVGEAKPPEAHATELFIEWKSPKISEFVGVANLATRWHEVPLASPGGVAERSESFKIMIASGNHSKIKKLLSEARLMRGGDG